ncbi:rhodanese-like domain-containing protein [Nitrincola tapanii]|uniref:Rhodanese domain-containing protein n=1 Tax=Nitrincola tapanii TaxID=1708751 RepID=A0A5A9W8S3_9GAMM|nr:rhodanese-like domain-containing protein [Nitrincola tapanii]KAA0876399.1 hypothetical protein E1H14_01355 [Nitrincola tapanii]
MPEFQAGLTFRSRSGFSFALVLVLALGSSQVDAIQQAKAEVLNPTDLSGVPHFSAEGYRIGFYRSPTPEQAEGGQRIELDALQALLLERPDTTLIDVQPTTWREGIFIYPEGRQTLPGSTWLPNVGWGESEEHWQEYFAKHLYRLSQGQRDHPIVIYCTADCWMSWNAVKRAANWGYTQLFWYSEGSDGWYEAGLPWVKVDPEPWSAEDFLNATGVIP